MNNSNELKEIKFQLNRMEAKQTQMNELYQKTFTALIQSHPDAGMLEQALQDALPKPSTRATLTEGEEQQLVEVIKLQQAKGYDASYLEKLITWETLSSDQYSRAIKTIEEWLSPVGALPSRSTTSTSDKPFMLTPEERSRIEKIDADQKRRGYTSDFLENKLKLTNFSAKEYTRLMDTLSSPKNNHIQ